MLLIQRYDHFPFLFISLIWNRQANGLLQFVPRSWILDELIERVEKKHERDILPQVMKLVLNPFQEEWKWNSDEEERYCGEVPKYRGMMQCSCSS